MFFFYKLDPRNAYHLVRIHEGDECEMAFNTPLGHFEYLFTSWVWRSFCSALWVAVSLSLGYHSQLNSQCSSVLHSAIPAPGACFCAGGKYSRWCRLLLACPLLRRLWVTNLLSLTSRRTKRLFHPCEQTCNAAGIWRQVRSALTRSSELSQTQANLTAWARRYGCHQKTSHSRSGKGSWRQGFLVFLRWRRGSTQGQCDSDCRRCSR